MRTQIFITLIALVTACSAPVKSQLRFIADEQGGYAGLAAVASKQTVTICLNGADASTSAQWKQNIADVVMKWIQPMRAVGGSDVRVEKVNVVENQSSSCDGYVRVRNGIWATTNMQDAPIVNVASEGYFASYNVLLHEFGHAFGLFDTYYGGTSGACQSGQPQSVMCNTSFNNLQSDDIAGVTSVYKRAVKGDRMADPTSSDPVSDPNVPTNGGEPIVTVERNIFLTLELFRPSMDKFKMIAAVTRDHGDGKLELCSMDAGDCSNKEQWTRALPLGHKNDVFFYEIPGYVTSTRVHTVQFKHTSIDGKLSQRKVQLRARF